MLAGMCNHSIEPIKTPRLWLILLDAKQNYTLLLDLSARKEKKARAQMIWFVSSHFIISFQFINHRTKFSPLHTKDWAKATVEDCSVDTSGKKNSNRYVQKHSWVCKKTLCRGKDQQGRFILSGLNLQHTWCLVCDNIHLCVMICLCERRLR